MWGIKTSGKKRPKSLLLTFTGLLFSVVFLANYFFVTDFRIWVLAIKVFKPIHIICRNLCCYVLPVLFYGICINQQLTACGRAEGMGESADLWNQQYPEAWP